MLNFVSEYEECMAGYKIDAEKTAIDELHRRITKLVPVLAVKKEYDIINEIFFVSFFVKGQKEPDEEYYNAWIQEFADIAFNAGREQRELDLILHDNQTPRLGFIGLGDDPSAYEHIYFICKYLNERRICDTYLFLFSYGGVLDHIEERFRRIGTPVIVEFFTNHSSPNAARR